ncbi:MAG: hypothetical protein AAF752_05380 [Bacteroidota bacterium]
MRSKTVSRLLLGALVAVTGLVAFRLLDGPAMPNGTVVWMNDLKTDALERSTFEVGTEGTVVAVEGVGSFQSSTSLAAYGWIVRRETGELVWSMKPETVEQGKGSLARIVDEVRLPAGTYDAYFTAYGNPLMPIAEGEGLLDRLSELLDDDFERWRSESNKWLFTVRASDPGQSGLRSVSVRGGDEPAGYTVWDIREQRDHEYQEKLFAVSSPTPVRVRVFGEALKNDDPRDYGYIEDLTSGERIWTFSYETTLPAGGSIKNRMFDGTLMLLTGRYRAVFVTDRNHSFRDWEGNPPYVPSDWGMRITVADQLLLNRINEFDPWQDLPEIVSITRLGDDALESRKLIFDRPTRAYAYGVGEMTRSGRYDFGWIINERTAETIWEFDYDESQRAGGARKNRLVEGVVDFEPGIEYTVYYQTDGSHSFGDWNSDQPDFPARWGLTLFALSDEFTPALVDAVDTATIPNAPGVLADLTRVGNNKRLNAAFTLEARADLRVTALGELTRRGRHDYGWIENRTGRRVWEMTRENTEYAGSTSKNRIFDGIVTLPAGDYVAHYQTDDSHAFPSFNYGGAPDDPNGWGLLVRFADAPPAPPEPPAAPNRK